MTVSWVPSLIRTLGPAIRPLPGKSATALRRRLEITHQLIDQLPRFDYFEQYFDPRIQDALAFIQRGFRVCHAYSFKTPEGQAATAIWSGMVDKTRNLVRKAEEKFHIAPIGDVEEFCRFYESNLDGQSNRHGSRRLRTLLRAVQVRNAGVLLGAWTREGVLCAAVGLVWDSHAVYYLLSTRHQQLADSGTVALLIWRGMQIACSRNMAFELDGVTSPAVFQFLSGFGASLVPRLRVQRITRRFRLTQAILSKLGRSLDAVVAEGKRAGMLCLVAVSQLCPGDIGWIF